MQNDHDDSRRADNLPSAEPTDQPDDDGDWEEFDPAPLEKRILDDFDWEIEESYPERGDYWDDSLDGQWDLSRWGGIVSSHRVVLVNDARQSLADSGFPGGAWEPEC